MLFIHIRVNILDVVTKYVYQQCMNFEPHAATIISRKSHITENCNQIWLTINNVDYVLLNVNYVDEPMVFSSCDWNRNIHDWKSGAYYADIDCMPHAVVALWLKPRSHIACNRSATSLRPKLRVVAGRLQEVAGTILSQGGFGCCKWNLSATKSIVEMFLLVADWLQTIPTQFLVADWSPTSRRSVADRSPKSCKVSAIKNKRSRHSRQPVADRSPIGWRSLPNWSPTDCRLIADGSTTTVRLHEMIV